ncbi:fucose permease [Chitinophaga dinghuensis]|uniref:Fucose permease n=1 Tax=Chitinophaga dinghuensis TaxID=1539050 RepID=A0A327W5H6_9BACT|nr:MFS transporter [Chitinophaga dinghuensis]RAJ85665.1 fucose permease [Chitinophaga dinghuensis]
MIQHLSIDLMNKRTIRIAVSALFFLTGLCFSSWTSRIADIQLAMHLNNAGLGTVLLALPIGSLISLPTAGVLVSKYGSRQVVVNAGIVYAALLPVLGLAQEPWQLMLVLVLFGFSGNLANIAVNTQAVAVESMYGRSIMASFHGLWSAAGATGIGIGWIMVALQIAPVYHFLVVAFLGWTIVAFSASRILQQDAGVQENQPLFAKPDRFLLILGIIAFCSMICEGTMFEWSIIYFRKVLKIDPSFAVASSFAFMTTMATGRFIADSLRTRFGAKKMLIMSGLLTASGLMIAVIFPYFFTAIFGFMLVGLGVCSVVPLVYSAAGTTKLMSPGMALATVSTIGYLGFLCGPPLIGYVAQLSSLSVSFTMIAVMGALIAVMSSRIKI